MWMGEIEGEGVDLWECACSIPQWRSGVLVHFIMGI